MIAPPAGRFRAAAFALVAGWPLSLFVGARTGALDSVLALYSALALLLLGLADRRVLVALFVFRPKPALFGAVLGALLVAAAHVAFPPLARALPFVEDGARAAYGGLTGPLALLTLALVAAGEEALFRGALPLAFEPPLGQAPALVLATLVYAVAQGGAGLLLLPVLALGFGALFSLERHLSGSLWAPLATHLVWTPSVAVLFPVA